MNDLANKIIKAKKKLKKLQKRQRKQDKQGVIGTPHNKQWSVEYMTESQALIKKVGEVILDGVKDIYGNSCVIKPVWLSFD